MMMKTIDLNKGTGARLILFPDQQPHVVAEGIDPGDDVMVICSITDSVKLVQLLQTANALDHLSAHKKTLVIPYLMAARYDRLMVPGDSFDLEVVAKLINSMGFEQVLLWDVHSSVATGLIEKSVNIKNRQMVESYDKDDAVLICPDAGAGKKVDDYAGWNPRLKDIVYCQKKRELSTGRLELKVIEPEKCEGRNCVIIDDICDGGATFLAVAEQINPKHLTLIVTHGIFSRGFEALEKKFDQIIVSDSFRSDYDSPIVKLIHANLIP